MLLNVLKKSNSGTLIDIEVVPNSKKESFQYDEWTNRIKVKIKEPAVKCKANLGIIKKFSEIFNKCEIVSGHLSRKKTVLIPGMDIETVSKTLESII